MSSYLTRRTSSYVLNDPDRFVLEAAEGSVAARPDLLQLHADPLFVSRRNRPTDKVALVSGGGSGHEPLHVGFVGPGMLDAAVPGAVFSSPTALQVKAAARSVDTGRGVLFVVKNYTGDVLNFAIAAELLGDDHEIATVVVDDDLATASTTDGGPGRRGTAAVVAVEKLCGAAAERGASLTEVQAIGTDVVRRSATLGVAYRACTNPLTGVRSFDLDPGEIEFGVGIHGERGIETRRAVPADDLVATLLDPIRAHLDLRRGDDVVVVVNGLGSAHPLELGVAMRAVARQLSAHGVRIARTLVGSFVTSLDMHGLSLTVTTVDDALLELWDAPVATSALNW